MAENEFLIALQATGADPDDWTSVETLLSSVDVEPSLRTLEWEMQPYSSYKNLANGQKRGQGFPVIKWTFKYLRPEQRENLRDFCSGVSANVYIRTPVNETAAGVRAWKDYLSTMNWMERGEIIADGLAYVEMVEITFTHCIYQEPPA